MSKDRAEKAMAFLNKKYGKTVVKKGEITEKKWLPTGIATVDWALGGGFIQGGIIELYGPPSSGKSTLALKAMALAQKQGKVCAYIDIEDAFDSQWAEKNGIDNESLILIDKMQISEVNKEEGISGISAESVLQIMLDLIRSKGVDVLILDSIACLTPMDELKKEMNEEGKMAGVAKILNRWFRVANATNQRETTLLLINQIRDNVGNYGGGSTTPGGKAGKFYAQQRVNVKRGNDIKKSDEVIGYEAKVTIDKNKVAVPKRSVTFVMNNDSTIDRFETYWCLAKKLDNYGDGLTLKGRTYSYNDEVVAKSQDEFREWLIKNPEIFTKLESSIITKTTDESNKEVVQNEEIDDNVDEDFEDNEDK